MDLGRSGGVVLRAQCNRFQPLPRFGWCDTDLGNSAWESRKPQDLKGIFSLIQETNISH
jgi:hypothetical protein